MEESSVMKSTTSPGEINMLLKDYDSLNALDISNYDWKCRVRAQSIWTGMNRVTKEVWGINIVFVDDSNCKIHAFVNAKISPKFEKDLIEGGIFVISNFKVKQYLGDETNRAVRNEKHIYFTEYTEVKPNTEQALKIEDYVFDFSAMEEIEKIVDDNRFLIDMVGVVEDRRPLLSSIKDGKETIRLKFNISNGSSTVKVTFFNAFAEATERALIENTKLPQVLAIASGKVGKYKDKIYISNFPATRIYVNPGHYCVQQVRERYEKMMIVDISSPEEEEIINILTVKELTTLDESFLEV